VRPRNLSPGIEVHEKWGGVGCGRGEMQTQELTDRAGWARQELKLLNEDYMVAAIVEVDNDRHLCTSVLYQFFFVSSNEGMSSLVA
jgi:hypothetical protein